MRIRNHNGNAIPRLYERGALFLKNAGLTGVVSGCEVNDVHGPRRLPDDQANGLKRLGISASTLNTSHQGKAPNILGIGVPPKDLRLIFRQSLDLGCHLFLGQQHEKLVLETGYILGKFVSQERGVLEGAEPLCIYGHVILVVIVGGWHQDKVRMKFLVEFIQALENFLPVLRTMSHGVIPDIDVAFLYAERFQATSALDL
ncbi:MAG: hypothetical protein V1495_06780 [Pseudomonadota bacterium]